MDISFKCPVCDQELEVDASGAGSSIECPSCNNSIMVPQPDPAALVHVMAAPAPEPPKEEKHFSVPVHEIAPPQTLIQKTNSRPLDAVAKDGDKTMRIRTFKRTECVEVGKDRFDEKVSAFLEKVGQVNIVSITAISYSYVDLGGHHVIGDYGVMIVFKG